MLPLSGFVLAGGRSSRMGVDKAMLRLGGVPLVEIAVAKLRAGCAQVGILGDRPELAEFGEVFVDRVTGAGPLAGIDASLRCATEPWCLFVPVDVPLVPGGMLMAWAEDVMADTRRPAASVLAVDGMIQPLLCVMRRELAPFVAEALDAGERKVRPVIAEAASRLGGMRVEAVDDPGWPGFWVPSEKDLSMRDVWFANLNTAEEFGGVEERMRLGGG